MYYDVKQYNILRHGRFRVVFEDGLTGDVELAPSKFRGVFETLQNPECFRNMDIINGAITWPALDVDLAPDAMYAAIKQQGVWRLE